MAWLSEISAGSSDYPTFPGRVGVAGVAAVHPAPPAAESIANPIIARAFALSANGTEVY